MTFNTIAFALFMPLVFALYWLVCRGRLRAQNILLLAASYLFYGWWDWRFLGLLIFSTLVSWACALPTKRRLTWTAVAVAANLVVLGFFKYFNFFGDNLRWLFQTFGLNIDWVTIEILLPVGISFYTFQAISYNIDVYRGNTPVCRSPLTFALFVAFFPQLVAGPIERSTQLMPQLTRARSFDYGQAVEGMRLILWGLFKKCAVADGLGLLVDLAWGDPAGVPAKNCLMAVMFFPLQVYADFSGYSDIAKGTAALLGVRLMDNFLFPFYSRNAIEFWQRWHRSLMQWFTQYVYIPLGGSRTGHRLRNVCVVFILSGLWHGANWTYVMWGVLCALWYAADYRRHATLYKPGDGQVAGRRDAVHIALTFVIFAATVIVFRAPTMPAAWTMTVHVAPLFAAVAVAMLVFAWAVTKVRNLMYYCLLGAAMAALIQAVHSPANMVHVLNYLPVVFAVVMLCAEWRARTHTFALQVMPANPVARYAVYMGLYLVVWVTAMGSEGAFIYFRF